jgi:CHAT domain-containing protein
MVNFHQPLLASEGKADALRHAREELRRKPEFARPYNWPAFILLGNRGPLALAEGRNQQPPTLANP